MTHPDGMNDFQRIERRRAYARAIEHLKDAHAHLRAAGQENLNFALGIELPAEKILLDAMHACAHVYQQPADAQG